MNRPVHRSFVRLLASTVCAALLVGVGHAVEIDPAVDTLSPSHAWSTFPYSWSEIRGGEFDLTPMHWQRSPANPLLPRGMNSRPVVIDAETVRVYYGNRGTGGGICYFDVDPAAPEKIKAGPVGPIITTGPAGSYDDDWVLCPEPVWISPTHVRMYYAAKKKGGFFAKTWSLACADSLDGGATWTKHAGNPLQTATDDEWESGAVGFTSVERDDRGWRMWYLGTDRDANAVKQIGYATSSDGLTWDRHPNNPVIAVDPTNEWERGAVAVARVIRDGRLYRAWYCCYPRNDTYAIGSAESVDGLTWVRTPNNPVLKGDGTGFDSAMTAYPGAVRVGDRYLMYYSGNAYGGQGIGLATAETPRGAWLYRTGTSARPGADWTAWRPLGEHEPPRDGFIQFAVVAPGSPPRKTAPGAAATK